MTIRLVEWLRTAPEDVRGLAARATWLRESGDRLGRQGRPLEALVALRESVERLRPLAWRFPVVFLPGLALSLAQWSALLSEPGRRSAALKASREAVALFRARGGRGGFEAVQRKHEARLNALLDRLLQGEATDASPPPEPRPPESFPPALAEGLHRLGLALKEGFRGEEALGPLREAAELYRELARRDPALFVPRLAGTLGALGDLRASHPEEAVDLAREAVERYRELARDVPEASLAEFASCLWVLVHRLEAVGRFAEAVEPARHAVALYRQLARKDLTTFWRRLPEALHRLGLVLSKAGPSDKAEEALREAIALYRQPAYLDATAWRQELAASLRALGTVLSQLGRPEEASNVSREAEELEAALTAERVCRV